MLVYFGARAFSIREKENFLVFSDFFRFSVEKVPKEQKGSPAGIVPDRKPTLNLSVDLNIPPFNFPRGMNRLTPSRKTSSDGFALETSWWTISCAAAIK